MNFNTYQEQAFETEQPYMTGQDKLIVPLLGLAGETGELLGEYKKRLRDGDAHVHFDKRVAEELGDLLWYIANVATKFELKLSDIAEANLAKVRDRWLKDKSNENRAPSFDSTFPEQEQIPRQFNFYIFDTNYQGKAQTMAFCDGLPMGDLLTDNSEDDDGYRFHDAFHLAYAAVLGWSPVTRFMLSVKRRSNPVTDEVEDGGRARAIEEGISALVSAYAEKQNWLKDTDALDYTLLRTIKNMTSKLEVKNTSTADWQNAILQGFAVWRSIVEHKSGLLEIDLNSKSIRFIRAVTDEEISAYIADYPEAQVRRKELKKTRKKISPAISN